MDVETILGQIRERVLTDQEPGVASMAKTAPPPNGTATSSTKNESLTRVSDELNVVGRASTQLPPLVTNRRGAPARLELLIKRLSKPLTRWFTWEQVNFNRATHNALSEILNILNEQTQEIIALRTALANERGERQEQVQFEIASMRALLETELRRIHEDNARFKSAHAAMTEAQARLGKQLAELAAESTAQVSQLRDQQTQLARGYSELTALHSELTNEHLRLATRIDQVVGALRAEHVTAQSMQDQEMNRRLAELAAEVKEAQRVCFRQLSLEASEAAILEDRGRRALIARLESLEKSLESRKP